MPELYIIVRAGAALRACARADRALVAHQVFAQRRERLGVCDRYRVSGGSGLLNQRRIAGIERNTLDDCSARQDPQVLS